jgi:hypothetical protein
MRMAAAWHAVASYAHQHPGYRALVRQAILWAAGRGER